MAFRLIVLITLVICALPLSQADQPARNDAVAVASPPDASILEYEPDPALSEQIRTDLINRLRVNSGAELALMVEDTFQQANILLLFKQLVAPKYGIDPHNVGDALCVAWISSWSVANGVSEDTPIDNAKAACLQIRSMAASSPEVASMNNEEKQDLAETLIYEGLLLELAAISAREHNVGDPNEIAESAKVYALNSLGVDMTSMSLTPLGFQKHWAVTPLQAPSDAAQVDHNPQ